ncbi:MAG TPA: outer membrane protein assembly factor BamB [Gammaproteobacteria bacterium]|nr:outer membrane protein assembly factor BamB [Gammaproteobacteria bacterium]
MKHFRIALLPVLILALAACSSSNIHQPNPLPVNPGKVRVQQDWSVDVGGGGGDQLLGLAPDASGAMLVAASAGGHVVAVNTANGRIKWQRYLKVRASGGPAIGAGVVVVGTRAGNVIALDASNGHTLWKHYVNSPVIVAPTIGSGHVIVNTLAGDLMSLDAHTGSLQWTQSNKAPSLSLRTATRPLIFNGSVYGGFADGKVMAVSAGSGKQLWLKQIAVGQAGNIVGDMVDVGRQMAYTGGDLYVATYQGKLAAVAAGSGQVIWSRDLSSYTGVTLDGANLYSSDAEGRVHAFDLVTGLPKWTYGGLAYRRLSAPRSYGSVVAVGDHFGYLHFIDRNTGKYLGRIDLDDGALRMAPIVAGSQLIVLGQDGDLVALQVKVKQGK